jgi:SanA protein
MRLFAKNRRFQKLKIFLFCAFACSVLFVWGTNRAVLAGANGRVYVDVESVPSAPVALVLGSAPTINGIKNPFFERRMDAAAALYRAGKVAKLLVSGDNHVDTYDEPTAMKDALVSRGVPGADIALDYAGFHTLDSIIRAHKVFGVDRCVIVTDDFHLPRALYIASHEGVDAVGFQTVPLPRSTSTWTYAREVGSRSLIWLDLHVFNRQPKFLGPKETL